MNDPSGTREIEPRSNPARLHYLDWLRVIAILMVFLFHAVHPFDFFDWEIKNAEQSEVITILLVVVDLWGLPFFFMVAGAAGWFALRQRTARQYLVERVYRLLIPFIVGTILFSPLEYYLDWRNKTFLGEISAPFPDFLRGVLPAFNPLLLRFPGFSSHWIGVGFHLWFLGFLFLFALFTIPLFRWLKSERSRSFFDWLAGICSHRGGVLVVLLPLLVVQFSLRPFFIDEHDWADFVFLLCFFILGYILYADGRITAALRRDGWLFLAVGTVILLALFVMYFLGVPVLEWGQDSSILPYYLLLALTTPIALCYSLAMLFIGMRWLDFSNWVLRYLQEAILPFFVLHQPVIITIAFFVVQWRTGIGIKLLVVVLGSFAVTLGLYELVIKRIRPLRLLTGMKAGAAGKDPASGNG